MQKKSKIVKAKVKISQKIGVNYTKKLVNYTDPVTGDDFRLKIESAKKSGTSPQVKIYLPEEKSFFRGVKFTENVRLEKSTDNEWIKILQAKFGAGAEELFGVTELNEESELEARDIRIIAAVEDIMSKKAHKVKITEITSPQARKAHI